MRLANSLLILPFVLAVSQAKALDGGSASTDVKGNPDQKCELHVFPQDKFVVSGPPSTGVAGPLMESAVSGIFSVRHPELVEQFMKRNLNNEEQVRLIRASLYSKIPAFKSFQIIREEPNALPFKRIDDIKVYRKLSNSASDCYAELMIMSIMYMRNTLSRKLYVYTLYREFGSSPTAKVVVIKAPASAVDAFPPKNENQEEAARVDLRSAFTESLLKAFKGKESLIGTASP